MTPVTNSDPFFIRLFILPSIFGEINVSFVPFGGGLIKADYFDFSSVIAFRYSLVYYDGKQNNGAKLPEVPEALNYEIPIIL